MTLQVKGGRFMIGGALKSKTKEFLCLLQEVSYLLQEAYKKAKLVSKEDLKAWNMSMRPTLIHVSTPHPFSIILFMSLSFFPQNCVFYRKVLYFYRKHPVEPLDEPNPISKVNLMVGVYWLGLQALVCPSLALIHHFSTTLCFSLCFYRNFL